MTTAKLESLGGSVDMDDLARLVVSPNENHDRVIYRCEPLAQSLRDVQLTEPGKAS